MADRGELDVRLLRDATRREQALHLRHVLDSNPAAASSLTSQLISLVAAETLPPIVLGLWPSVANQPEVTVAVIRQELCVNAQQLAIKHLHRHLRREKTFAEAWEAAGGAKGVAQLAAKLSVDNVRYLLGSLGSTARAQGGRKQRRQEMEKLLELLWGQHEDGEERGVALDGRPLRKIYLKLLPACGGAFRVKWEEERKRQLQERHGASVVTDSEFFESHYDERLRRKEIAGKAFLDKIEPLVLHRPEYGLQVLERFLASENLLGVSPDALFDAVIHPLGKRFLSRRRISNDTTPRFWTCLILGLKERSAFQKTFLNCEYHFKTTVARLVEVWNRLGGRAEYTEMLPTLFSALPEAVVNRYSLLDLLRSVGGIRRYQLLRLFLKHTAGNRVDIGEPASLEHAELEKKSSFRWQSEIFFLLPAEEALPLWEKVQRAGKDVGLTSSRTQGFSNQWHDPEQREVADRHVVRALLLRQIRRPAVSAFSSAELDAMRAEARHEVSRRMKKATQGRSFEDRSQAALSALALSAATGDLELYADTLRWARRFNKDPLTVKELYSQQSLLTGEAEDVLAVLYKRMKDGLMPVSVDELTKRIHSANVVLTTLYETASMGVNEPSFSPQDWQPTFELIQRVVCLRLNWVNDFQDQTKMSDDSLYEAVWKPTSAMLEKMLSDHLGPVGERFEPLTPYVTLSTLRVTEPQKLRGHTIRFLNHLAEFQDSLWAELRRRETPALVTVDELWPKGATLQQLSSYFGEALAHLPYAQARAETVVFMDPLKALQPIDDVDEAAQLAIGTFVDSFTTALQLYIQRPGEERKERILRAWQHATIALSKDRMSPDEAERFWWVGFESVGVQKTEAGIDDKADERPQPSLPNLREDELMQPTEWNPDPEYDRISQPEKDRFLAPVLLDVLLTRPAEESTARFIKAERSIFGDFNLMVPAKPRPCSFWAFFLASKRTLSGRSADAYATAAILAMNMKVGSDMSLLKTPYPPAGAVRIPAVYLDQDFLERFEKAPFVAFEQPLDVLAGLKYHTPTGLLVQLAESVLESIKKNPPIQKPIWEFQNIISFILDGKDPSLATPLIQRLILENPDDSSWHRVNLNSGSLGKLPPAVAKEFFESFTNSILDKLQERADLYADKEAGDDAPASKAPLIKITTVKMLAQLLRESPVIDSSLAVDLNIRILKRASHVDVRTASVKGLTEAITNSGATTSLAVKKRILDALREYAVPIASSVNESQPFTDWDARRPEDDLPEIWEDGTGVTTVPPIMSLILDAGRQMDWRSDEGRALKEITSTMLDASAETNKRWMSLFLKKNGFSLPDSARLPAVPLFPSSLEKLLHIMGSETPDKWANLAMEYLLLRTNPPEWLTAITQAVGDNKKLAYTNAGTHWRSRMWNSDGDFGMKLLFWRICTYLDEVRLKVESGEIQKRGGYQSMEAYFFDIADAVLMQGRLSTFEAFMSDTSAYERDSPVWGRIVERINGLRTPAWQADPNRKPAVLPDTLGLKIRMLDLPRSGCATPDSQAKETAARCAEGVVKLLEEIVADGKPYARRFDTLQKELQDADSDFMAEMGIAIAATPALDDASVVTLVDYLRLELAVGLLDRSHIFKTGLGPPYEEDVVKRATEVVTKMSGSVVEEFRMLAAPLQRSIENTDGWDWWC